MIIIVALLVLALDQISKYWIVNHHLIGQLGYTGSLFDLESLRAFLSQGDVALNNSIPKNGNFIVLSFTANDAALWGIGNGKEWAVRLLLALTAVFLMLLVFFTVMLAILTGRVYKNRLFKRGTKGIFDEILAAITGKAVDKADDSSEDERKVPAACYDNYDNAKKTYTIVGFSLLALMLGGNVIGGLVGNVIANMMAAAKDMDLMSVYEDKTFLVVQNIVGMYVIAMPLCALFMKLTNDSVCKVKGTIEKNLYIRLIFIMFPVTYGLAYFSNFIASALSKGEAENPLINNFLSESNVWAVIMVAFLAPIFEELVFRKLIIDRTRRYGEVLAIVYSSVAFGLFHCNVYQIFYAFAIGLILGYVYVRTGNVILTIIIHMIMNSSSSILYPLVPEIYTYFQYIVIALGIVSIIYTLIKRDIKLETVNADGSSKELSHIAFANAGSILFSVVCILFMIYSLFAPLLLG